jgi:hypothetical protein
MAAISIGDALSEGFGLIRRQPMVVMIWGGLQVLWGLAMMAALSPFSGDLARSTQTLQATEKGRAASSSAVLAAMGPVLQFEGLTLLMGLVSWFVGAVFMCAAYRTTLHPQASAFAFVKLGRPEIMLFLLGVGLYLVLMMGAVIATVPLIILGVIAWTAHAQALAVLVGVAGAVALATLLVWIVLRLSLAGPMMVQDGRFHLTDAWRLTRGHVGALFAMGLCLVVIYLVALTIQLVLTLAFGGAQAGPLLQTLQGKAQAVSLPSLTPGVIVRYLVSIPISGCLLAITAAPWARAYRDLAQPDVAATFA